MVRARAPQREAPPSLDRLPYERPDLDALRAAAERAAREHDAARTDEARARTLEEWDRERARLLAAIGLATARHARDCRKKEAREEQDHLDAGAADLLAIEAPLARRLLERESPLDLLARRGRRAFERAEAVVASYSPAATPLYVEEAQARTRALRLLACAGADHGGERRTLPGLAARALSRDPEARRAAHEARVDAIAPIAGDLDACYARLVEARRAIAMATGHGTAPQLAFARGRRRGYNPWWASEMREAIGARAALLRCDLLRIQNIRAGRTSTDLLDERLHDALASPAPPLPRALAAEATTFLRIAGPPPDEAFERLVARGCVDVEDRPGKLPLPRAVDLVDPPLAAIVASAAGGRDDVPDLLSAVAEAHRLALAAPPPGWLADPQQRARPALPDAAPDLAPLETRWADGASRALCAALLPLCALASYETFFGKEGERARLAYVADLLASLARWAAIDRFEAETATWSQGTAQDRDRAWRGAESVFLPWRTYDEVPRARGGLLRAAEPLLYEEAFAAQDRLLGTVAAAALWGSIAPLGRREQSARAGEVLHWASRLPFLEVCARCRIPSPLTAEGVAAAMNAIAMWLEPRR